MKSIYVRPTNIIFGQKAKFFLDKKKARSLCGLENAAFLSVEILTRQSEGNYVEEYNVEELEKIKFRWVYMLQIEAHLSKDLLVSKISNIIFSF